MNDYDLIVPRLYIGGAPVPQPDGTPAKLPAKLHVLVLCARTFQPPDEMYQVTNPDLRIYRCPLDDVDRPLSKEDRAELFKTVRIVRSDVYRGRNTLITCNAGLNRSALIAALVIRRLHGLGPNTVIDLIRKKRKGAFGTQALSNSTFVKLILESEHSDHLSRL